MLTCPTAARLANGSCYMLLCHVFAFVLILYYPLGLGLLFNVTHLALIGPGGGGKRLIRSWRWRELHSGMPFVFFFLVPL